MYGSVCLVVRSFISFVLLVDIFHGVQLLVRNSITLYLRHCQDSFGEVLVVLSSEQFMFSFLPGYSGTIWFGCITQVSRGISNFSRKIYGKQRKHILFMPYASGDHSGQTWHVS